MDVLAYDVVGFVVKQLGIESDKLSLSTRILYDLGCDGDDASNFMVAFASRYNVDMSDFEFKNYFTSENEIASNPFILLTMLYFFLLNKNKLRKMKSIPVAIKDLVNAAYIRKWPSYK